jgi:hypothetical protein
MTLVLQDVQATSAAPRFASLVVRLLPGREGTCQRHKLVNSAANDLWPESWPSMNAPNHKTIPAFTN